MNEQLQVIDAIPEVLSQKEREDFTYQLKQVRAIDHILGEKYLERWEHIEYIRVNRLYREDYESWDDFCKKELSIDESHVGRRIKDVLLKRQFLYVATDETEEKTILNIKEAATRFIRELPEETQEPFWKLAYSIGVEILPKKDDGSIEITKPFLERALEKTSELLESGGITLDGQFIPVETIEKSSEMAQIPLESAQAMFLSAGVSEEHLEALARQRQYIKDKTRETDSVYLKGNIEIKSQGELIFPVLVDKKGDEYDLLEIINSYEGREITFNLKGYQR